MSNIRRRIFGGDGNHNSSTEQSRTPSPVRHGKKVDPVPVPAAKVDQMNKHLKKPKSSKRRYAWNFGLGGLFGVFVAAFFAKQNDMIDMAWMEGVNLDSIIDVLPAGLMNDAREFQKHEKAAVDYDSFAVGLHARSEGIEANFPVIMVPGVISTGLESWGTSEESRPYFRKRLWGSWSMMKALVTDKANWKRHIMLDTRTGLDPPNIKLRASQGFDAADFFITGYWIWSKILENLATIGYDPSNAFTAAYDWRLSYGNLEVRDRYFTRLKSYIEMAVKSNGKKTVLLSHSMGSQVLFYFMHWVEELGYGNGGSDWVDKHIEAWINISGCMLGTLKGFPAVLSGEMKDTAQLNAFAVYGLEKFLSRHERAEIFRTLPGISSMLPMGGDAVWGNHTWAPDDKPGQTTTFGKFVSFRPSNSSHARNLTVNEALPYLFEHSEDWYADAVSRNYSFGVAHTRKEVEANQRIPAKWVNPLETRLPLAPNMKIYCFYGIGKDTERAYFYKPDADPLTKTEVTIDTGFTDSPGSVDHGVVMGEGDGTVSLLSSGYMCNRGWRMKRYNPAGIQIKVSEMPHEPDKFSPRGGPNTGDHVDILGRSSLNDLILRVAGGRGDLIEENIASNIMEYADKVQIRDDA